MSPRSNRRSGTPIRLLAVLAAAFVVLSLAGCAADFDPSGPCTTDGKVAGAYPDLEALVPKRFRNDTKPAVDSGRTCTTDSLGTLAGHGVKELRFAGATFSTGTQSGLTLATFTSVGGPALQPDWLTEFYSTTAKTAKNVQSVDASHLAVGSDPSADRLDVLNDESYQTVIVWSQDGRVVAALVADFIRDIQTKEAHEVIVQDAIGAILDTTRATG